jgi:hypothetical protein
VLVLIAFVSYLFYLENLMNDDNVMSNDEFLNMNYNDESDKGKSEGLLDKDKSDNILDNIVDKGKEQLRGLELKESEDSRNVEYSYSDP